MSKTIQQLLFVFILMLGQIIYAQNATVIGKITDENGKPLEAITVAVLSEQIGTYTDKLGRYNFKAPIEKALNVRISFPGYVTFEKLVYLQEGETYLLDHSLKQSYLNEVKITGKPRDNEPFIQIDPKQLQVLPNPGGGVEAIIKTLPGVRSNSELSSQYSVRGGNFDENLIYVNDFEIYKPFLVRSGQQEGLSFINPDMVGSLAFSAGGFEARYGDKLSSVLNVDYKKPEDNFGGTASLSLLGGSLTLEGKTKNDRFKFLTGFRNKTNSYLLSSLETKGQYNTTFSDVQTFLSYSKSDSAKWEYQLLANYARNKYQFAPQDRETTKGLVNRAIRLNVFFAGQEVSSFENGMVGLAAIYKPTDKTQMKFMASGFRSLEAETFDIIGAYFLGEVETDLSQDNAGDVKYSLGSGEYQDFARNYLLANVLNFKHIGLHLKNNHEIRWGVKAQYENISDELNEWNRLDSAGYSLPYNTNEVIFDNVVKTQIDVESYRFNAFLQDTWSLYGTKADVFMTGGVRASYWDLNEELLISPRMQLTIQPEWDKEWSFKVAGGLYHQPAFYRELRDLQGNLNTSLKAQKSAQIVAGADYNFEIWDRPFKLSTELYYKHLWDLVSYDIDNSRIRYSAQNDAVGYVAGFDVRINGEFVPGDDSWLSFSMLQTRENIEGDYSLDDDGNQIERGYIKRPTDQLVSVGMFFQDHIPGKENLKVHMTLLFASGLPYGPPKSVVGRNAFTAPPYRRFDIGFSAMLWNRDSEKNKDRKNFMSNFKTVWASLEAFNLVGIKNTVSYIWVKDITNTQYPINNFLTGRRINLKIITKF